MQKSTIFIVMLAIVSVAIIGKLFAYDYLRQGWADIFYGSAEAEQVAEMPAQPAETPAQTEPLVQPQQEITQPAQPEQTPEIPIPPATPSEPAGQPSEVQQLLENIKLDFEKITSEQLIEAGFKNAKVIPVIFDNRIFQMIDVSDATNAAFGAFNIADEKNIYTVVVEAQLHTELEAQDLYSLLKKRAQGMPGITINEINQFGDSSLFMNDPKRPGTAFLIVRVKNHVYAYTYPKANHEFIKKLIIICLQNK